MNKINDRILDCVRLRCVWNRICVQVEECVLDHVKDRVLHRSNDIIGNVWLTVRNPFLERVDA